MRATTRISTWTILAACGSCATLGQTDGGKTIEAASIRRHTDQVRAVGLKTSGPRITISAFSVTNLVQYAYDLKSYQVSGGPDWARSDRYDIVIKAEGDAEVTTPQVRAMIQTLIEDRFQANVHREMREMPVYALVVAGKNGARLKESAPEAVSMLSMSSPNRVIQVVTTKGSTEQLVAQLSGNIGRPVIDKTGLTGNYDYTLQWAPDNAPADLDAPSIFAAVQEQLGLKLESTKSPIEVVVIERVERPSEN